MREINILVRCDMCIAQGSAETIDEADANSVKVTVDQGNTLPIIHREMDICSSCLVELINMSRKDAEVKATPKRKKGESPWRKNQDYWLSDDVDQTQPWVCNYCTTVRFATEQGVKQHLSRAHKVQLPA